MSRLVSGSDCFVCDKHAQGSAVIGGVIYEDELSYVGHILPPDLTDVYLGYLIVEPKRHVIGWGDLSTTEASALGVLVNNLARLLKQSEGAEHVYSFVFGDAVPHLHIHLVPRYPGTPKDHWGVGVAKWPEAPRGGASAIAEVCDRLREGLAADAPRAPEQRAALPQVRRVIERLVRDGAAVARSDGTVHNLFPVAVSAAEGEALRAWVTHEGATRTIEVGLGYGISALFICEGLLINGDVSARHTAIDPYQAGRFANCGLQFLEEAGLGELVEHHAEESQIALPRFLDEKRRFDLAFVDGNHRFDGVFLDLVYLGRLVRRGGIIFLDDYQLPAVRRAASFFRTNLGWRLEEVSDPHDFHQWAVLRTADLPDTRPFDYYVDF